MVEDVVHRLDPDIRAVTESLIRFDTTDGNESTAQSWLRDQLVDLGFDVVEWTADADVLAEHPSFPDDPAEIEVSDRPNVAGVLEFGEADAGPTLVLNGHMDVVPVERSSWRSDPFEPTWDDDNRFLTGRGAVDMKAPLAACIFAAVALAESEPDIDGRLVVESVVGEEEGGIGAAAGALENPYSFDRDAAIVAEPTELRAVTAVEGTVMKRLRLEGRSAHAATRWEGESVIPHFHRVFDAFHDLEAERAERVTHPLYTDFDIPWPINFGIVKAGTWASSVPAELMAEIRIGVAPGESVEEVEREFENRLATVVDESEWLAAHPPSFDRFSIMFEPAEIDADEPIVKALQSAMKPEGLDTAPTGATYGADNRHYTAAGIPTVVFGPGSIEQAHYPNETIDWNEVLAATTIMARTAKRFLDGA